MLLLIVVATLNSVRFFSDSKQLLTRDLRYRTAENLKVIADFLKDAPPQKVKTSRFRELVRVSGLAEVILVETEALRSDIVTRSKYVDVTTLRRLWQTYSTNKEVIGEIAPGGPVTLSSIYQRAGGQQARDLYFQFTSDSGEMLTLVARVSADTETRLARFSFLSMLFQILSLVAAITVAVMLLRITFAPYQKIKDEAIAAQIAQPDQPEAVDFAVDTFHKVIAELKQKEQRLQKLYALQKDRAASLEKYNEYILESMPSGVASCNVSGRVTQFNRAAARILRSNAVQVCGQPYGTAFADFPLIVDLFAYALQAGVEESVLETTIELHDGKELSLKLICRLLYDNNDAVKGAMVVINDLTEIKRLEAAVTFKEEMASLGEMSAGLAHQLRNSLAAMIGFTQLLQKLASGDRQLSHIAASLLREAKSTEKMLKQFLSYSAPGEVKRRRVEFREMQCVLEDHFAHPLEEKGIVSSFAVDHDLPLIYCDPLLITNSIKNLVQNSIDACAAGGEINITVKYLADVDLVEMRVSDTGVGMEQDQVAKVFNPFYTSGKADGTGLGLSLVRKWIITHQGEVNCVSTPGEGTTFTITLPNRSTTAIEQPEPLPDNEIKLAKT